MADDQDEFSGDEARPARAREDRTEGVRIIGGDEASDEPALRFAPSSDETSQLPHWTDPPSGEIPRLAGVSDDTGGLDAWSSFAASPSWKDDGSSEFDLRDMTNETRLGALGEPDDDPADFFPELEASPEPAVVTPIRTRQAVRNGPISSRRPPVGGNESRRRPAIEGGVVPAAGGGRDMPIAIGVGIGLAVLALVLFKLGPAATMILVVAVLGGAAAEFYEVMRRGGYQPATLLGLVACTTMPLATYWKGETGLGVVLVLSVAATFAWYMFAEPDAPTVLGVATTMFGVLYVGVLGSYAALILRIPDRQGVTIFAATIVCVAAVDIGGLVIGSSSGSAKLAPAISPNKTWEGVFGGAVLAVIAGVAITGVLKITPWDGWTQGLWLGVVVVVMAVLGDLSESKLKRDLGIKDMGTLLPGHGGLLDRFDGLLFALPAVYYLAVCLKLG
jgi:phosphatidate cytidylyltransferase